MLTVVVAIVGSSIPLPAPTPNAVQLDVIMLHPDGSKAMESTVIDATQLPTRRERFNRARVAVAASLRALGNWKGLGG